MSYKELDRLKITQESVVSRRRGKRSNNIFTPHLNWLGWEKYVNGPEPIPHTMKKVFTSVWTELV